MCKSSETQRSRGPSEARGRERRQVERAVAAVADQLGDAAADRARLHDAAAGEAVRLDHVREAVERAEHAAAVRGHRVQARPAAHVVAALEAREAVREPRPDLALEELVALVLEVVARTARRGSSSPPACRALPGAGRGPTRRRSSGRACRSTPAATSRARTSTIAIWRRTGSAKPRTPSRAETSGLQAPSAITNTSGRIASWSTRPRRAPGAVSGCSRRRATRPRDRPWRPP